MNRSPARTLDLLAELKSLGFTDQAFATVHHFEDHKASEHAVYCQQLKDRGSQFLEGSTNTRVQRRLEIILAAYRGGNFTQPKVFQLLSEAAVVQVPI